MMHGMEDCLSKSALSLATRVQVPVTLKHGTFSALHMLRGAIVWMQHEPTGREWTMLLLGLAVAISSAAVAVLAAQAHSQRN